ncbi:DNA mismatch endonuclease Vsr [Candidatus Parcubacteria bacterium]|nr:MAG: DNA mismatch endonuclease Vsr [Candidatus Parcubacteria bacterium]
MPDIYSKEKRSQIMARVRSSGTKPELTVRQIAHALGYRFRLHRRDLPGKPDIVFPRYRRLILVHGCFWHGHDGCTKARRPVMNSEFWDRKLSRNRKRDTENAEALRRAGWRILVVWECETKERERLATKIFHFMEGNG